MSDDAELQKGLRVLVIEDDVSMAHLLETVLGGMECKVVGPLARTDEVFALLKRSGDTIDMVLLDVNLAGVPAYPIADELTGRKIPFAFVTGYGESGVADAYVEYPLLQKPFRAEDLKRTLIEMSKKVRR
jgi:two-component SAPR family response regulator